MKSPPLYPEERAKLWIFKNLPENKDFDQQYNFNSNIQTKKFKIDVPEDCLSEETRREDHDTPFGAIVEIVVQRRKKVDNLALKPKRFSHLSIQGSSQVKLLERTEDSEKT